MDTGAAGGSPLVPPGANGHVRRWDVPCSQNAFRRLSLFKLEYCQLIVGSERKIMSRGEGSAWI